MAKSQEQKAHTELIVSLLAKEERQSWGRQTQSLHSPLQLSSDITLDILNHSKYYKKANKNNYITKKTKPIAWSVFLQQLCQKVKSLKTSWQTDPTILHQKRKQCATPSITQSCRLTFSDGYFQLIRSPDTFPRWLHKATFASTTEGTASAQGKEQLD